METLNTIIHGDALSVLKTLPSNSVQASITSPPYFGLRDYNVPGQIGLEETPDCGNRKPGRLELRPGLNSDEFDYVLRELAKCGLI